MPRSTRANPRPDLPIPLSFACDVRWEDMLGSGDRRLCTRCNTQVVDVSALSEAEARRVMAKPGVCVNYRVREGQVVYGEPRSERPVGRRSRLRRLATAAVAGLVAPGIAQAGASAPQGSLDRLWSWVSDLISAASPVEQVYAGGLMPEPFPPGEPAGVVVAVDTDEHEVVELVCASGPQPTAAAHQGEARLDGWLEAPERCVVRWHTDPMQQASVTLAPGGEARCAIAEGHLSCQE